MGEILKTQALKNIQSLQMALDHLQHKPAEWWTESKVKSLREIDFKLWDLRDED